MKVLETGHTSSAKIPGDCNISIQSSSSCLQESFQSVIERNYLLPEGEGVRNREHIDLGADGKSEGLDSQQIDAHRLKRKSYCEKRNLLGKMESFLCIAPQGMEKEGMGSQI